MASGFQIATDTGATLWWPYSEIRQTQGFYAGEHVRLERGGEIGETLLISDPAFLTSLHTVAPELGTRFHNPARRWRRIQLTLLAAVASVALGAILYVWGIPAMAMLVAPHVPRSWEESLGRSTTDNMINQVAGGRRCGDPTRVKAIDEIVQTLLAPLPKVPYTFRVTVVNSPIVNAFAAPGGYVVVFRGLIERTRSAEELAGVIAHELQHVLEHHATRLLLQHASTGILITALTGDLSGATAFGLQSAQLLGTLRYSRAAEDEADAKGMKMLIAARVDPAGMIAFFEVLEKHGGQMPAIFKYLSTHPSTQDRIARLKTLAAKAPAPPVKLLPGYNWKDMAKICEVEK